MDKFITRKSKMKLTDEQTKIVNSKSRILFAEAGPGTGKSTTMIEKIRTGNDKGSVLILTKYNSVKSNVISDLGKKLHIKFVRSTNNNHYISNLNGTTIAVTSLNSFLYWQLQCLGYTVEEISRLDFKKQLNLYFSGINKGNVFEFYIRGKDKMKIPARTIHIDEIQDLSEYELRIFCSILHKNTTIKFRGYGDVLQTLMFEENLGFIPIRRMQIDKHLECEMLYLTKCFRCPKGHIDFLNCILEPCKNSKFGELKEVQATDDNEGDKPFLFCINGLNDHRNGQEVFRYIEGIIDNIKKNDANFKVNETTILSPKINNSPGLLILYQKLNQRYNNSFHYFETSDGENITTINFDLLKDKNGNNIKGPIISINGYKGCQMKLVIVLNLAEGNIPMKESKNKINEIVDYSKLNVSLSRSTKYLFVGLNRLCPSSYYTMNENKLVNLSYNPWQKRDTIEWKKMFENAPRVYVDIYDMFNKNDRHPPLNHQPVRMSDKLSLNASDVSKKLRKECFKINIKSKQIGIDLTEILDCIEPRIFGLMVNTLMLRVQYMKNIYRYIEIDILKCFVKENVGYISDDKYSKWKDYCKRNESIKIPFNPMDEMIRSFWETPASNVRVFCNEKFKENTIVSDVIKFLDKNTDSRSLESSVYWNIAIILEHIQSKIHRFDIFDYVNKYNEDITLLYDNILVLSNKHMELERQETMFYNEYDADILKEAGIKRRRNLDGELKLSYSLSITCRIDCIDDNNIYELKASKNKNCSDSWIIQSILNERLYYEKTKMSKNIIIYNVLKGELYEISFNCKTDVILENIMKRYHVPNEIKDEFIENRKMI